VCDTTTAAAATTTTTTTTTTETLFLKALFLHQKEMGLIKALIQH